MGYRIRSAVMTALAITAGCVPVSATRSGDAAVDALTSESIADHVRSVGAASFGRWWPIIDEVEVRSVATLACEPTCDALFSGRYEWRADATSERSGVIEFLAGAHDSQYLIIHEYAHALGLALSDQDNGWSLVPRGWGYGDEEWADCVYVVLSGLDAPPHARCSDDAETVAKQMLAVDVPESLNVVAQRT